MTNHFTIVIPSYNAEKWVEKNLKSIFMQNYERYDVYYIDDCSSDLTYHRCKTLFNSLDFNGEKKTLIRNSFNKGKMCNLVTSIKTLKDDTIVIIVDGDDWLNNTNVLNTLNDVYSENVWMTNGSYIIQPHGDIIKPNIDASYWTGNIRFKSWQFSHLGTFRKKLFDKIKKKDLINKNVEWYNTTSDQAIMWPMAEMSGPDHHRVVKEVVYCYNRSNPLADDLVNRDDQLMTEREIRHKNPYSRLKEL